MLALMRDSQVPLNMRIDIAATAASYVHAKPEPARNKRSDSVDLPDRTGDTEDLRFQKLEAKPAADGTLSPLDILLAVMNDPSATPRQRVKAAGVAARYKHPPAGAPDAPTVIVVEDKFGFKVDPELARAERDDRLRAKWLDESGFRFEEGSDEEKAVKEKWAQIRKRRAERLALLQYPQGYLADDLAKDCKRLEELMKTRIERKKLTPEEDAEEAHLATRVASYQLNPELLGKAGIRDLEERSAIGLQLTAAEEQELRDLRKRYPELAAEIDLLDLRYMHYWGRELEKARKAGLGWKTAVHQARDLCVGLRDPSKFGSEWEAEVGRHRKARAASREP
jgi:hypothetical protein